MITHGLLQLIGLSEEQYSQYVFDSGLRYAEEYYKDTDTDTLLLITGCKAYWDWYRNQFKQKDEEFMAMHNTITGMRTSDRLYSWQREHEPCMLEAHPGSDIAYQALQPVWDNAIDYKSLKQKP